MRISPCVRVCVCMCVCMHVSVCVANSVFSPYMCVCVAKSIFSPYVCVCVCVCDLVTQSCLHFQLLVINPFSAHTFVCVCVCTHLVTQACPTLCDTFPSLLIGKQSHHGHLSRLLSGPSGAHSCTGRLLSQDREFGTRDLFFLTF